MRRYQKFIVLIIGFFLIQPAYANESKASYADLLDKGLNRWQNADFSDALDYYGDALKKAKTNSEKSKARTVERSQQPRELIRIALPPGDGIPKTRSRLSRVHADDAAEQGHL